MQAKSERFELRLDSEILDKIDGWRSDQRDVPSRSEAVRRLVNAGLGRTEHTQLFHVTRFTVLCAAMTPGPKERISDAYAYAWQAGVYPEFNDTVRLHRPFAEQFDVPRDMVKELAKFLDDRWLKKEVPSFYELEDYYDVRSGRGFWDRLKLVHTCRYMFLNHMFNEECWDSLMVRGHHPTEATSIITKFDRARDIFME
jgi:hypothetical protein